MKKTLLLLLLFVSNFVFAQDLSKDLETFKSIIITSAMDVELISSENSKIEVIGNDIDKLTISNKNKELKLTTSLGKKFKSDLKVKIYYTTGLRYLKLSNQVVIYSKHVINEVFLELEAINNVKANLKLKTKDFVANLKLGSNISLEGSTEVQKISVSSKSFYDAFNFKSKKSFVKTKAADVAIYVEEFLDVNAKLKSKVTYMGDPYSVNEKTFLSKVIHKKK